MENGECTLKLLELESTLFMRKALGLLGVSQHVGPKVGPHCILLTSLNFIQTKSMNEARNIAKV